VDGAQAVRAERPDRRLGGDAPEAEQDVAIDPRRGAGIGEIGSFEKAGADRRTGDPLVETPSAVSASEIGRSRLVMGKIRQIISY
jgi:hypothetical protein